MDLSVIIFQIIVVLINAYIAYTENKSRIYVVTFLFNFANMCMYFFNGDKATTVIYIVISIRSLVYIYKDKFKTIIIPILAMLVQLAIGFKVIDNLWQLIPILVPCVVCYYMWFCKTTQELRVFNAICNALWVIYNLKTQLYIVAISRAITTINNILAYMKNRKRTLGT